MRTKPYALCGNQEYVVLGSFLQCLIALALCIGLWPAAATAQTRTQDEAAWRNEMSSAMSAHRRENYDAAERNLRAALDLAEGFGPEDGRLTETLLALSTVRFEQEDYEEARRLLARAVAMREESETEEGPPLGPMLIALAQVNMRLRNFDEADALFLRAVEATEAARGPEHRDLAQVLESMAGLRMMEGRYEEVEPFYARALRIRERAQGPEHPDLARTLESYAALMRLTGRVEEAEALEARAGSILGK